MSGFVVSLLSIHAQVLVYTEMDSCVSKEGEVTLVLNKKKGYNQDTLNHKGRSDRAKKLSLISSGALSVPPWFKQRVNLLFEIEGYTVRLSLVCLRDTAPSVLTGTESTESTLLLRLALRLLLATGIRERLATSLGVSSNKSSS